MIKADYQAAIGCSAYRVRKCPLDPGIRNASIDAVLLRNNAALISAAAAGLDVSTILKTVAEKTFSGPLFGRPKTTVFRTVRNRSFRYFMQYGIDRTAGRDYSLTILEIS